MPMRNVSFSGPDQIRPIITGGKNFDVLYIFNPIYQTSKATKKKKEVFPIHRGKKGTKEVYSIPPLTF